MRKIFTSRFMAEAAIIGAIYAALTILFAPISYGQVQVRISEALTVLAYYTPAAIPGLFVGCTVANIFSGIGIVDIFFGSLATLIAAFITYKVPKRGLAPLPPVVMNAVIIGLELHFVQGLDFFISMAWVGLGELIACYGLGYPLMFQLDKHKDKLFDYRR